MNATTLIPETAYGILEQTKCESHEQEVVEQIQSLGYAVLDSGFTAEQLSQFSAQFNDTYARYVEIHGEANLREIGEYNTIRAPLSYSTDMFLALAANPSLLRVITALISGKFILNQQSGIINPPRQTYNQGSWHRDLPYQHFTSSRPLAINALFCLDPFTRENGATFVLPASHRSEPFPSRSFIERNCVQVEAKAGSYIILDCMLFHSGGFNQTSVSRRAVNHVYTIPFIKQQIEFSSILKDRELPEETRALLGFPFVEPHSVEEYLETRRKKRT